MIDYISIGSYRIKGDDWQSHPLREVVSPSFRAYSIDNQLIIDTKVVEGWRKL